MEHGRLVSRVCFVLFLFANSNSGGGFVRGDGLKEQQSSYGVYQGCFHDTCMQWNYSASYPDNNTIDGCTRECLELGYHYAGISNTECICSCKIEAACNGTELEQEACGIPCPGDQTTVCGGLHKVSTYYLNSNTVRSNGSLCTNGSKYPIDEDMPDEQSTTMNLALIISIASLVAVAMVLIATIAICGSRDRLRTTDLVTTSKPLRNGSTIEHHGPAIDSSVQEVYQELNASPIPTPETSQRLRSKRVKETDMTERTSRRRYEPQARFTSQVKVSDHGKDGTGDPRYLPDVIEPMLPRVVDDSHPYHSIYIENAEAIAEPSLYELCGINDDTKENRSGISHYTETSKNKPLTFIDSLETAIGHRKPSAVHSPRPVCSVKYSSCKKKKSADEDNKHGSFNYQQTIIWSKRRESHDSVSNKNDDAEDTFL